MLGVKFFIVLLSCGIGESKKFVNISGDIIIGALFPIHGKGHELENCGKIQVRKNQFSEKCVKFINVWSSRYHYSYLSLSINSHF